MEVPMETKYVSLWLEGPLQAWGHDSSFSRRETLPFPTKSGVLGMLLAAMGKGGEQRELLRQLSPLDHTVISFRKPVADVPELLDFQMVGSGYSREGWESYFIPRKRDSSFANTGGSKMTYRYYLQDAVFAVTAGIPLTIEDEVRSALECPVWPIFLGRRTCIPSKPVFRGIFQTLEEAEESALSYAAENGLKEDFTVVEGNHPDDGEVLVLNDVPICFGTEKHYASRYVTVIARNPDGQQSSPG